MSTGAGENIIQAIYRDKDKIDDEDVRKIKRALRYTSKQKN